VDYSPYIVGPFGMTVGKHVLRLTIPKPGLKLDFLELIPLSPQFPAKPPEIVLEKGKTTL
jgi:hypothetical protein